MRAGENNGQRPKTFELAHITDVHLGPLPSTRARYLLSKRGLGYLSWHRKRYLVHRVEVLDALIEDVKDDPPDHTVVTGDMVNIALPEEFVQAANWLRRLGDPERVTLVPGNHDAYSGRSWRRGWGYWQDYMRGDGGAVARPDALPGTKQWVRGNFPFVRRMGPIALIGLSSAVPSPVGYATGRLGRTQVAPLRDLMRTLEDEGLFRVVLVHHPPMGRRIGSRRCLRDERSLAEALHEAGAELVLSGHEHVFLLGSLAGHGRVPVVAGPSASLLRGDHNTSGGYLRYRIDPQADNPIEVELRRFNPDSGKVSPVLRGHVGLDETGSYSLVEHTKAATAVAPSSNL